MIPSFKIIVFILLSIPLSSPAFSQMYKWKDKDGNIRFSDTAPSGADAEKVKVLKQRETPTPKKEGIKAQGRNSQGPRPHRPPIERKKGIPGY